MRDEPRAGRGARARLSTAADVSNLSGIAPYLQREPFRVVIVRGLWKGCDVQVHPPTSSHPLRHCRDHADALKCASEIARIEGWPVEDRVSSDG